MWNKEAFKVSEEETWHGIPRSKIPWYPTINYEKFLYAQKIFLSTMKVFATEEKNGKKRTIVEKPNSCVVTCTGCDAICPTGAIKHPFKKEFQTKIRALRKNPNFRLRNKD